DAVIKLHRDYIAAGADVITVNNYAVTPALLAREGAQHQLVSLTVASAECAVAAKNASQRPARIAGSLPPLDTTYDASLVGSFDNNVTQYALIAAALEPYVDLYLCETLTTAEEARAAATVAQETGKPFMVSWTVDRSGTALRGGDSFATALNALRGLSPEAVLVNCSSCNAVTNAIRTLVELTDLPVGGYANPTLDEPEGGEPEFDIAKRLDPESYAAIARGWIADGATVVGGCCDTSPDYIAALR
ncbi:MAG: homocysteine S-methyltransferase family protein, partial [Woeseiaceae bacterium]|nr:homocysteine S-methyltransferase family protein [Woeseiaceae bacterium]